MNAGLPGTGLGGLFYIASAVWMPVHRARRGGGHEGRSWRRVGAQSGIAVGILVALFVTGWLLGLLFLEPEVAAGGAGGGPATGTVGVLRWVALMGTVGLLALLLAVVELAGGILRRRRRKAIVVALPAGDLPRAA